jgi:septal ring factor EnvC (AmiA/AmiB activator)
MTIDPVAQALHQKSVLGGTLTPEEQERLQRWYAEMDADEEAMFARAREREAPPADLEGLQTEIEETKAGIVAEAERIQVLEKENERLRREIGSLQRLIAQKKAPQSV